MVFERYTAKVTGEPELSVMDVALPSVSFVSASTKRVT